MKIWNFSNTNHPIFAKGFTFVELQPIHLWRFFHIWQLLLFTTPQSSFFATTPVKKKSKNYSQLVLHSKKNQKTLRENQWIAHFPPILAQCVRDYSVSTPTALSAEERLSKVFFGIYWGIGLSKAVWRLLQPRRVWRFSSSFARDGLRENLKEKSFVLLTQEKLTFSIKKKVSILCHISFRESKSIFFFFIFFCKNCCFYKN